MTTISNTDHLVLGIDIGGSHITAGIVDITAKRIIESSIVREKVDRHGTATAILSVWAAVINELYERYDGAFNQVGFAIPGPFDYENGICLLEGNDKYEALYGMNIRREIAARTNIDKEYIVFKNDADAFLEGEVFCGAALGYTSALALTLGTGLGSCVYNKGKINNAFLYQMKFKDGISEDYISTRWFEKRYAELTGNLVSGVKHLAEVYDKEPAAKLIFEEFSINLSLLLHHCIETYHPQVIVLGGNITKGFQLFIGRVYQLLAEKGKTPLIRQAHLGENAALIGAASNFEDNLAFI